MEASLVTRLEAVTSRLEALASKSGGGTSGGAVVDGKVNFVLPFFFNFVTFYVVLNALKDLTMRSQVPKRFLMV